MLTGETVTLHGTSVTRTYTYDLDTGFRTSQVMAGVQTTFVPDARGNLASETTAGKTTSYEYSWGQVSKVITPLQTTTRAINVDGSVAWEEQHTSPARRTTYSYDSMGRVTTTQGPGQTSPIVTSYNNATARTVTTTRGPSSVTTTLDGFGRPIETVDGTGVRTTTGYDAEGRVVYQGYPFKPGGANLGTQIEYDIHDRVTRETHPGGSQRQYSYGATTITTIDEEGRTTVVTRQPLSHPEDATVVQLVDAAQQTWTYAYNVLGDLRQVTGPGGVQRTWTYAAGTQRLTSETHPEWGTTLYEVYDAAGVLKQTRDANNTVFVYTHDNNQRLTGITATPASGPVQQTTIAYEPGSDNRQTTTVANAMSVLAYDSAGRVTSRTDVVDGKTFAAFQAFDAHDRLQEITYPTGRRVRYEHDNEGRITRVFNGATGQNYASAFQYHASGGVSAYTAGNGLVTTIGYHPQRHWVSSIQAGPLQLGYLYDDVGNVEQITDSRSGMNQVFSYDSLDRLVTATSAGYPSHVYSYDAHGNRQTVPGVATYQYHAGNPFRLYRMNGLFDLAYDNAGNVIAGTFGTYGYTPEWTNTSPTASVRDYVYAGRRLLAAITTAAAPK